MKKLKQTLAIFLAVLLMVSSVPFAGAIEPKTNGQCGDNVYWSFNTSNGVLKITGEGEMWNHIHFGDYSFKNKIITAIIEDGVTSMSDNIFYVCEKLANVTIPTSVTEIGYRAFCDCKSLKSVRIPDGVTKIDDCTFSGCSSLASVNIPDSVKSIGYYAFYECGIANVTIPEGVTHIGNSAFSSCKNLMQISVSGKNSYYTSVDGVLFTKDKTELMQYPANKSAEVYYIPSGVVYIDDWAFSYSGMKNIDIPDSVRYIGDSAFGECQKLTRVSIPEGVTRIDHETFSGCKSLAEIKVSPDNSKYSDIDGVLYNKDKTELIFYPSGKGSSYVIPNGVTGIADSAFYGYKTLKSITLGKDVSSVSGFVGCLGLKEIKVSAENSYYSSVDGVLYNKAKTKLILYPAYKEGETFSIPYGVTSIAEAAFFMNINLKKVFIPNSVTSIEAHAFYGSFNLEEVTVPGSVTNIGELAFGYCFGLKKLIINYGVKIIETGAFVVCMSLKEVNIPSSVETIGDGAFAGCYSLEDVNIANGVKSIEADAFAECFSIKHIEIPESVDFISSEAFSSNISLKSVNILNPECEIEEDAIISEETVVFLCPMEYALKKQIELVRKATLIESGIIELTEEIESELERLEEELDMLSIYLDRPSDIIIGGYVGSTAQEYAENNAMSFKPIGEEAYVTVHSTSLTDSESFNAYGVANAGATVSVYDGSELIGTTDCVDGKWSGDFTFASDKTGVHKIKAVVTYFGSTEEAETEIDYQKEAVYPTEFTVSNTGKTINMLKARHYSLSINPTNQYSFNVKTNKKVNSVSVTSTKNGKTKTMNLKYDSVNDTWLAKGWFENNSSYVPGNLGLRINGEDVDMEFADVSILIDPSGYVYEAVKSNRVEGATAVIEYKEGENTFVWDANKYEQDNPQITDANGTYHWDVSEGEWRVQVSKPGYSTAYSDWMVVPPEYTEVAIGLVTYLAPTVSTVTKSGDGYEVKFSQYMDIDSVSDENILFTCNGDEVPFTVEALDAEVSAADENVYFAKTFKLTPEGEVTDIEVSGAVNYAGIEMQSEYAETLAQVHEHSYEEITEAASCTGDGLKTIVCSSCGDVKSSEVILSTGHTSDNGTVTIEPTCTVEGVKTFKCTVCKETIKTEAVSKKTHTYTIETVNPTCTEDGSLVEKCSVCGDIKNSEIIPATGHTVTNSDGKCDSCGKLIVPTVDPKPCTHDCHKSGLMGFIWKIINFFNKIFKKNQYCTCGVKHW